MSLAVLNSRIKKMECENKPIPQKYIDCFNDYIKNVINTRVDQEIAELNKIIADKFELGKFKSVNELIYAYKSLEKEYTKSRQRIAELEEQLKNAIVPKFRTYQSIFYITQYYPSTKGNPEYDIISDKYYVAENENEIILGWNYANDFNRRKYYYVRKDWVFATKEEAEAKLKELGVKK